MLRLDADDKAPMQYIRTMYDLIYLAFRTDSTRVATYQVTNMAGMFYNAAAFNQPLGDWTVDQVTNMDVMFEGAAAMASKPPWYSDDDEDAGWTTTPQQSQPGARSGSLCNVSPRAFRLLSIRPIFIVPCSSPMSDSVRVSHACMGCTRAW